MARMTYRDTWTLSPGYREGFGMKTAIELIADERRRQIDKEYDAAHDDAHDGGQIATAAGMILYDMQGGTHTTDIECLDDPDASWMEQLAAHVLIKYGEDPIHRLTIVAAMVAAEIERLQRKYAKEAP